MAERVPVADLRLDSSLYPRADVDSYHVRDLVDALDAGSSLPPVIAWRATKQVIDGFHRVTAARDREGDGAFIEVEWRDYASEAEAFAGAVRLNAVHGLRLAPVDHDKAMQKARAFGMSDEAIARALKVPTQRLRKRRPTRPISKGPPRPYAPPTDPSGHRVEPRPLKGQGVLERHPILVAVGHRMEDVEHPRHDFSEAVKGALAVKHDPDALWAMLVQAAAAALVWATNSQAAAA